MMNIRYRLYLITNAIYPDLTAVYDTVDLKLLPGKKVTMWIAALSDNPLGTTVANFVSGTR